MKFQPPPMALERAFGISAEMWSRMDDLWQQRQREDLAPFFAFVRSVMTETFGQHPTEYEIEKAARKLKAVIGEMMPPEAAAVNSRAVPLGTLRRTGDGP